MKVVLTKISFQKGVFIVEVFPDGAAHKDGRLQAGDQILEICSQSFKEIEHDEAHAAVLKVSGTVGSLQQKIFKILSNPFLRSIHFESLICRSRWWCTGKRKGRKKSRSNCRRSREKGLAFV